MQTKYVVSLAYEELEPEIGAKVSLSKQELLSGAYADNILTLLEARGVIVFPKIGFTKEEQIAFTQTLAEVVPDAGALATTISLAPSNPSLEYARASLFWHFDGYFNDVPNFATLLCSHVLAAEGGDTEFASTYAAYEALPDDRKAQIEGLRAVHAMVAQQLAVEPEPSFETLQRWMKIPRNDLSLVWTHRTGRKSLVIGNSALNILGMDPLEGVELLTWLREWTTQPRFRYNHSWSLGDAVMWDNTGTLHRATAYDPDGGRLLFRTKIAGDEAFPR